MSFMEDREKKIIEAAISVFSRYGVKRTTMNDIAGEAGIVRQTLYNAYSNKDDVLRATIRHYTEQSLAAIEAEGADAATLGDALDIVFGYLAVQPFEQLNASPHAEDIISGFNTAARDEISIAHERYRGAIEHALAPHEEQIRASGLSPSQLAELIQISATSFKQNAKDKAHLLELLTSLKVLVLAVADGEPRGSGQ